MALFSWNQSYSVGVSSIDSQHKELVSMVNELHDAMKIGKGKEILSNTLNNLVNYTVDHFGHEEKLFTQYNYNEVI